ncbi:Multidrug resistance-like ATP-binding protein MdlA [Buchnera aphidicola (Eriosoma grossulariae)]|uniref:SmdA family multidrug ABC transporter permease/ATP-binding protein n=1 Tax=Buchnera aphidicola TaxID=9 RepID=UPI003463DFF5
MQLFRQLKWYFIKEWKRYLGSISLLIIISILQLLPPKLVGIIVDIVMQPKIHNHKNTIIWIIIMFFTALAVYILRYIWRILLFGASYQLAVELRIKFYSCLSKQESVFYLKNRTGDLMARGINDVDKVVFAAGEGVLTLVDSLVMGCSVLLVMSHQINFQLTMISLLPMPIMAILINRYGKQLHQYFKQAQAAFSSLNNQAQESLTSIRMIRAFGLEKHQSKKFFYTANEAGKKNMKVAKIDAKFDPTIHLSIAFSNLLAITFGGWLVWHGKISLGQLTSFIMYLGLMIWPMLAFAWMFNIVERGSAAWDRIQSVLKQNKNIYNGKINVPKKSGDLEIQIEKFYYPENINICLKKINISIKPGHKIGICGPTGSGKSTLIRLIQKNFNISQGKILYHNCSLSNFKIKQWRKKLAVVNQTTFLFSDSISNNIAFGKPDATQKEIEEVAKISYVHKDIIRLQNGYKTKVGEKGVMLSGGQKQRISIARALLLRSEFLILDDALSSIDAYTENKILNNLQLWNKNQHTIILTAHRLSALSKMNEIIVMKNGSINQRGSHNDLMREKNWYSDTYLYQELQKNLNNKK